MAEIDPIAVFLCAVLKHRDALLDAKDYDSVKHAGRTRQVAMELPDIEKLCDADDCGMAYALEAHRKLTAWLASQAEHDGEWEQAVAETGLHYYEVMEQHAEAANSLLAQMHVGYRVTPYAISEANYNDLHRYGAPPAFELVGELGTTVEDEAPPSGEIPLEFRTQAMTFAECGFQRGYSTNHKDRDAGRKQVAREVKAGILRAQKANPSGYKWWFDKRQF
jgi:hypothetical protein